MSGLAFVIAVVAAVLAVVFWFQSQSAGQAVAGLKAEADAAKKEADAARAEAREAAADLKSRAALLLEAREKLAEARKKSHDSKAGRAQQPRGAREAELEEDLTHARQLTEEAQASAVAGRREVSGAKAELAQAKSELSRAQEKLRELSSSRPVQPASPASAPAAGTVSPAQGNPGLEAALKDLQGERAELKKQVEQMESAVDGAKRRELLARDELRKSRGRAETNNRVYLVTRGELEVTKERLAQAERRLWQAGITLPVPAPKERPKAKGPAAADRPGETSPAGADGAESAQPEASAASAELPEATAAAAEQLQAQATEGEPIAEGQAEHQDDSVQAVAPVRRRPAQGDPEPKQEG